MNSTSHMPELSARLAALDPAGADYAAAFVDLVLSAGQAQGASDIHLEPTSNRLSVRWRLDGVLATVGQFPPGSSTNVINRLKVLAELLTYRTDVPQEGRIRSADLAQEMRVSTFPTIHGEKVVVRLFRSSGEFRRLADLGLPAAISDRLGKLLDETSGAVLVCGPAGSGKTTTLYACLREIVARSGGRRNVVSLEDPVEVAIDGVAQSQVNVAAGFDLPTALRSILRQDPEVILLGEIRDRQTAEVALQASLTGQLVLTSFHASGTATAVSRLSDMGIEPYVLASGVRAVIAQRLLRRLCDCSIPAAAKMQPTTGISGTRVPVGCDSCAHTGYRGRLVVAEMLPLDEPAVVGAVLTRTDAARMDALAREAGMTPLVAAARAAVDAGQTTPAEVIRVLGLAAR